MPFNHYTKIKRILDSQPDGWFIKLLKQPTTAKNFKGKIIKYKHYYRIYDNNNQSIKYCKFQQIDRLAIVLKTPVEFLPLITDETKTNYNS